MGVQRYCDFCRLYKQRLDGSPAVYRYGLTRQLQHPTKKRANGRPSFTSVRGFGALDICDDCLERHAGPKRRPELKGKTGPKKVA